MYSFENCRYVRGVTEKCVESYNRVLIAPLFAYKITAFPALSQVLPHSCILLSMIVLWSYFLLRYEFCKRYMCQNLQQTKILYFERLNQLICDVCLCFVDFMKNYLISHWYYNWNEINSIRKLLMYLLFIYPYVNKLNI